MTAVGQNAAADPALLRSGVEAAAQRVQEAISATAAKRSTEDEKKMAGA